MAVKPMRARWLQVWLLRQLTTGVYEVPADDELRKFAQPLGDETQVEAIRRVLDRLAAAGEEIDRQAAAAMTAAGFALAINGVLLKAGPVSQPVLFVLAVPALVAFFACVASFNMWVERVPFAEESFRSVESACAVCVKKRFWTLIGMMGALMALLAYGLALFFLASG
jgi:hypothetical protein